MVLVIDPQIAGIAGDMLLCSLVDMGADVEKIKKCASMGAQIAGTSIRKLEFSKVQKCGISATKLILETDKQHNLHTGKSVADCIAATCKKSNLSDAACKFADESVQALICAELTTPCSIGCMVPISLFACMTDTSWVFSVIAFVIFCNRLCRIYRV